MFHFINPVQVLIVCVPSTTSCQVLFEQRIFLLIFISTIRQIVCLSQLLLMRNWCQIVPWWILFNRSNFSFRLQPHSPIDVTSKYILQRRNIRPSLPCPCTTLNDLVFFFEWQFSRSALPERELKPASFPVILGDFGCDVTCQAYRQNSPRTPGE